MAIEYLNVMGIRIKVSSRADVFVFGLHTNEIKNVSQITRMDDHGNDVASIPFTLCYPDVVSPKDMFKEFIGQAFYGYETYEAFIASHPNAPDDKDTRKWHKGCVKAYDKFMKLFYGTLISIDDVQDG